MEWFPVIFLAVVVIVGSSIFLWWRYQSGMDVFGKRKPGTSDDGSRNYPMSSSSSFTEPTFHTPGKQRDSGTKSSNDGGASGMPFIVDGSSRSNGKSGRGSNDSRNNNDNDNDGGSVSGGDGGGGDGGGGGD